MSESDTAVLDPRQTVVEATRHTSGTLLYTAPVLDAAAALLADVWAAAEKHDVRPADLDVAFRCLEATTRRQRGGIPQTVEEAQALLRVLVEEFAEVGVTATFRPDSGAVVLARGPGTPTWGYDRPGDTPPALSVTVCVGELDGGWNLALDRRGTRMVDVAAPCDRAGAAAVARLAIEVNAGRRRGNPFTW
jgi:hypothetical protein